MFHIFLLLQLNFVFLSYLFSIILSELNNPIHQYLLYPNIILKSLFRNSIDFPFILFIIAIV